MSSVFIDTGAFVAFLDGSDRSHAAVAALFAAPPRRLFTSAPVLAEGYGWFLHRLGESAARQFLALLDELPALEVVDTDPKHRIAIRRKLDAHRGRKLTWVDASSLEVCRSRKIATVWGVDLDLAIEGARVLPGPPG